jgi:replication factor A1
LVGALLYTVNSLVEGAKGVTIRLRVVTVSDPRTVKTRDGEPHRVVDVQDGDWTGMTKLSLWDEMVDLLNAGDLIDVENGYVTRFMGRLTLNVGRYGTVTQVDDPAFPSADSLRARPGRNPFGRRPPRS